MTVSEICDNAIATVMAKRNSFHGAANEILKKIITAMTENNIEISYKSISILAQTLDERGFFELRGAVVKMSKMFGVSRTTIYTAINSNGQT
jgi:predicted transcriptional regulator YheO